SLDALRAVPGAGCHVRRQSVAAPPGSPGHHVLIHDHDGLFRPLHVLADGHALPPPPRALPLDAPAAHPQAPPPASPAAPTPAAPIPAARASAGAAGRGWTGRSPPRPPGIRQMFWLRRRG